MKEKIVCYCSGVSKAEMILVVKNGVKMLKDIRLTTETYTSDNCLESSTKKKGECLTACLKEINKGKRQIARWSM